jgi:hypothetical protein
MDKTLFIASFPDLGSFDFSKTGIRVGNIDNSDYYFQNNVTYIHSYIESLKKMVGTCDVVFVPATDKVISSLQDEGIKCVVLYPNISCKEKFVQDLIDSKMEEDFISMIENSWEFIISRLDKKNYDYKFAMGEDDKVLDVLKSLIDKKDVLGVSCSDVSCLVSEDIVDSIFSYCLLREDEFSDGKPSIQSIFCEGIKFDCFFSLERLGDKKESISTLINSIKAVEEGISVNSLGILKNGRIWTDSLDKKEKVMVLGIGNGDLIVPFSRNWDSSLKGSVPYVIKSDVLRKGI